MLPRVASDTLLRLARGFPVVALTGPRKSGKTTLARVSFPAKPRVSLENPDEREFAEQDPRRFLARFPEGAILDEIQRCPALFSWLQGVVDERQCMGDFVLTGSAQFDLFAGVTQSLAGRVGRVELLPLSATEMTQGGVMPQTLDRLLLCGGYPALYDRTLSPGDWFPNYVATYLERDVRQLVAVRDLSQFQRFIRMCAARSGQLLNLTALGADCGVSAVTAREWLSVLEASYLVVRLQPWYRNFNKRLVKTPKLYFYDTGLVCWLLGIREVEQVKFHAMRGALFENLVISECHKHLFNQGEHPEIWFWRDRSGHEVDMVLERSGQFRAVEVKSGQTLSQDQFKGLQFWQELTGNAGKALLVYGGEQAQQRTVAQVVPWRNLAGLCDN